MNAFMHQTQSSSATSLTSENCSLDVKPTIQNGVSQSTPKQREGTTSNNNTNSNNNNSSLNGGIFDNPHSSYSGYESSYGYHQGSSGFPSSGRSNMSPHSKPQRTKPRTSAGKTILTRCGVLFSVFLFLFFSFSVLVLSFLCFFLHQISFYLISFLLCFDTQVI